MYLDWQAPRFMGGPSRTGRGCPVPGQEASPHAASRRDSPRKKERDRKVSSTTHVVVCRSPGRAQLERLEQLRVARKGEKDSF